MCSHSCAVEYVGAGAMYKCVEFDFLDGQAKAQIADTSLTSGRPQVQDAKG
ncbi:MAG: hypothetical protein R3C68_05570 [Myxococcota bacterium]